MTKSPPSRSSGAFYGEDVTTTTGSAVLDPAARQGRWRHSDVVPAVMGGLLQLSGLRAGSAAAPPDLLAGVFGALLAATTATVQGASLLWRRTQSTTVLGVCVAAYAVNVVVVPGVPPYAAWFALYAAGVYTQPTRRARLALAVGAGGLVAVMLVAAAAYGTTAGDLPVPLLVTAIVVLLSTTVRSRRAQLGALRDRASALEREAAAVASRAAVEERLRIAREVHDLVGHGLSGIAVQSSTARLALEAGQLGQARAALSAVESSSRSALQEMRQLLDVLRAGDEADYLPTPGARDLRGLVDGLRGQGVSVELSMHGVDELPDAVSVCVYRVVQEALTNAVKHAPGSRVTVELAAADREFLVAIENYAQQAPPPPISGGHGLLGMRERVAALGGDVTAGPTTDHPGWLVHARIPVVAGVGS